MDFVMIVDILSPNRKTEARAARFSLVPGILVVKLFG